MQLSKFSTYPLQSFGAVSVSVSVSASARARQKKRDQEIKDFIIFFEMDDSILSPLGRDKKRGNYDLDLDR